MLPVCSSHTLVGIGDQHGRSGRACGTLLHGQIARKLHVEKRGQLLLTLVLGDLRGPCIQQQWRALRHRLALPLENIREGLRLLVRLEELRRGAYTADGAAVNRFQDGLGNLKTRRFWARKLRKA